MTMKKIAIIVFAFCITISCSSSKYIISDNKIRNLNSVNKQINCIIHNYFANHNNALVGSNYKFLLIIEYKDFEQDEYQLYISGGINFKDLETKDFFNYLKKNEIFNIALARIKKNKDNLRIIDGEIYSIIKVKSVNKRELKQLIQE